MERKPEDEAKDGRPSDTWRERLAADIKADAVAERQAWGDTDDLLLARYVSGLCTDDEKARVEQAMRDYPAVRESIEVVREIQAQGDLPPPSATDSDAGQKRSGGRPWSGLAERRDNEPGTSR